MDPIVTRIISTMNQKGINGVQLGELLEKRKSPVTDWKNGKSKPTLDQVIKICENFAISADFLLFGIENVPPTLRGDEKRLLRLYNEMDGSGRRLAMVELFRILQRRKEDAEWWETHEEAVVKLMEQSFGEDWNKMPLTNTPGGVAIPWEDTLDDFERDDSPYPVFKSLPRYLIGASAGTGAFLDSSDYVLIDLPVDKVPIQATFCVAINGDSMTPDYNDEDILFVKQQPTLENGELGIFQLNGDVYFKKYVRNEKQVSLVSLNTIYPPIPIGEPDEVRVIGKVLGKYVEQSIVESHAQSPISEVAPEPAAQKKPRFTSGPPKNLQDFPAWFDEQAQMLEEGTLPESDDDFDVVKPGDPEYDMHVPWAASGGAHLDPEKDARMQKGLRLAEKRARLASEEPGPEKKNKDKE